MKRNLFKAAITAMLLGLSVQLAPMAFAAERAVLHFADVGGIRDWRAIEDDALLIEGRNGNWYRATFWGSCYELRFTDAIGFITEPTGDLDKFSSILVGGQRCRFRSFSEVRDPERYK